MGDKSYPIRGAICGAGAMTCYYLWFMSMYYFFETFSQLVHDERHNQRDLRFASKMTKENFKKDLEAYFKKMETNEKIVQDEDAPLLERSNALNALQQDTAVFDYLHDLLYLSD